MMGKKKLSEIKAEVALLLAKLPGRSSGDWLQREIRAAQGRADRDVETLEMLRAALEREARSGRKPKPQRPKAKR